SGLGTHAPHLEEGHGDRGQHDLRRDVARAARRAADRDPGLRLLPGQGPRGARGPEPEDRGAGAHLGQAHALLQGGQGAEGDGRRGGARRGDVRAEARDRLASGEGGRGPSHPDRQEPLGIMRVARRVLAVAAFVGLLVGGWVFAARHPQTVAVDYFLGRTGEVPLWIALLGAAALGGALVGGALFYQMLRLAMLARRYRRAV